MSFSSSSVELCPLKEIATIERDAVAPGAIDEGTTYVGLENIDSDGKFVGVRGVGSGELASNKFRFGPQHVLFGKLRPYLRKTARPSFSGICSTDIVPILPGPRVDRDYLFHFLRHPKTVEQAVLRCAGANLPRLSPRDLSAFAVPIPSIFEQRRIADILDKAESIRGKRKEAIALTEDLLRSAFLDMFGDIPARRSKWPFLPFRSYLSASSGKSSKSVISTSDTAIPVFGGNGVNGWATQALYEEPVVVVGRVGQQCGITQMTDGPAWVTDNAIVVSITRPDILNPVYLMTALQHSPLRVSVMRLDLPFINQSTIMDFPLPLPPLSMQEQYTELRRRVMSAQNSLRVGLDSAEQLFDSLLQRAFRAQRMAG